jgi:hypothetical protein
MSKHIKTDYWIIDTDAPGVNTGSFTASGPFPSQAAVEAFLIRAAKRLVEGCGEDLRNIDGDKWGAPVHIVQRLRTVRQVPSYNVTVKLAESTLLTEN